MRGARRQAFVGVRVSGTIAKCIQTAFDQLAWENSLALVAFVRPRRRCARPGPVRRRPVTLRQESGNLVLEGIPAPRRGARRAARALLERARNANFLDWLPDGAHAGRHALRRRGPGPSRRRAARHARAAHVLSRPDHEAHAPAVANAEGLRVPEGQGRRRERSDLLLPDRGSQHRACSRTASRSTAIPCGRTTASGSRSTATRATA